jgi:TPR repeat protein
MMSKTLKRLLLAASMCCLVATANAAPMDEAWTAYSKRDYKEAMKWYKLAAAQGDAQAQYWIGAMYYRGRGVIQDYKEAVRWYRLAAEQGDAQAQYWIGAMYYRGHGFTRDHIRAHMWFNLSSSAGHAPGTEIRDQIAEGMTPQQIEKAQDMARACQARNFKGC